MNEYLIFLLINTLILLTQKRIQIGTKGYGFELRIVLYENFKLIIDIISSLIYLNVELSWKDNSNVKVKKYLRLVRLFCNSFQIFTYHYLQTVHIF